MKVTTTIKISFILFLLCIFTMGAKAQCPADKVCISQAAAQVAASNARELEATKNKVAVLEDALIEKDKSIVEIRNTAAKNELDLRQALVQTSVELGKRTGEVIAKDAEIVRQTAYIEALIKKAQKKCILSLIC